MVWKENDYGKDYCIGAMKGGVGKSVSTIYMQRVGMMIVSMRRLRHRRILTDFNFKKYPQNNKKCGCFLK